MLLYKEGRRNKDLGKEDVERSREKRRTSKPSKLPILCSYDLKLHKHLSLPRRPRKAAPPPANLVDFVVQLHNFYWFH